MNKKRKNISLPPEVFDAAEVLSKEHRVNISYECEKAIRAIAKKFKVKIK